jgi:imidazolonepropionase-like amidohydrolase
MTERVPSAPTALRVGRLIDGTGGNVVRDALLRIKGTTIASAEPFTDRGVEQSGDAGWHLPDCTVLPGLIDAHTHLSLAADGRTYEQMATDSDVMMALIAIRHCRVHLNSGVTTLRDNGSRNRVMFIVREALERGYAIGPRLLLSGRPITPSGGHFSWCNGVADGVEEVRRAVRLLVSEGADFIKIMATGGGTASSDPKRASYSVEEMRAAVEAAHDHGRLTTAHCRATEGMVRALAAGLDCMEHAEFLDVDGSIRYEERIADKLADSDIYVSPTLQAFGHYRLVALRQAAQERRLAPAEQQVKDRLERHLEQHLGTFRRLLDLGLGPRIIAGTDAGPGYTEFGQMAFGLNLMVAAGMTPMEAIMAATSVAARACDVPQVGSIAAGKEADLLVVNGDPSTDIDTLRNVVAVFKGGQLVHVNAENDAAPRRS